MARQDSKAAREELSNLIGSTPILYTDLLERISSLEVAQSLAPLINEGFIEAIVAPPAPGEVPVLSYVRK